MAIEKIMTPATSFKEMSEPDISIEVVSFPISRQGKVRSCRMQAHNTARKRARENEDEFCGHLQS